MVQGPGGRPQCTRGHRPNQLSQISGLLPPRGEGRGRGKQSTWPPGDLEASGVTCEERSCPQAPGKEHGH